MSCAITTGGGAAGGATGSGVMPVTGLVVTSIAILSSHLNHLASAILSLCPSLASRRGQEREQGREQAAAMSRLTLRLCGSPLVCHGDRPLTFRTRKTLALLLYLVVEETPQPRAHLTSLFWPERDAAHGRAL